MASGFFSEDLACSLCGSLFTDPVTLTCGHSFCRSCVSELLECPQCGTCVSDGAPSLPTSVVLKKLAERAKELEKIKKERGDDTTETADLCPEHEEKLKLFCVSDQQMACIICRDDEKHEGHKFKTIKDAAASLRKDLEMFLQHTADDINAIERLSNTQQEEIRKTKDKSEQLMTQISRQFQELQQFLRKREDEIKNELKQKEADSIEKMTKALNVIETTLSESKELESKATSVLNITDQERFFKTWTEETSKTSPEHLFRSRVHELQLENTSLSMGPYESHLQLFVWKEMLRVIKPQAQHLTLRSNSPNLEVSSDGRSLFWKIKTNQSEHASPFGPPSFVHQTQFGQPQTDRSSSTFGSAGSGFSFGSAGTTARSGFSFDSSGTTAGSGFGLGSTGTTAGSGFSFDSSGTTARSGFSFDSSGTTARSGFSFASTNKTAGSGFGFTGNVSTKLSRAYSAEAFTSGQFYWEVEVGSGNYWELGLKAHFLKYDGGKYSICGPSFIRELKFENKPRKIGIYLNLSCKKLSFYDADIMAHIQSTSNAVGSTPVSAYFSFRYKEPEFSPLTVCRY